MKKLLVLMLVLGIASLASAGLQISVGGNPEPLETEYTLLPSETIELDIWTDSEIPMFELNIYALAVASGQATITNGTAYYGNIIGDLPIVDWNIPLDEGIGGTFVAPMSPLIGAGEVIADGIIFHCEAPGDVVVELWSIVDVGDNDFQFDTLLDTVIIHQTPEPMTMALLGLGGLFLRRRK